MIRPTPEQPGPGQLSVWDFPRPPALVQWHEEVQKWLDQWTKGEPAK